MSPGRRLAVLLVGASLAAAPLAQGWGDDEDHEAAEAALARGVVRPVQELLQRVRAEFAGSVLKIELEDEGEGGAPWVYEVKVMTPQGNVLELEYDAATLELIGLEGRYETESDD